MSVLLRKFLFISFFWGFFSPSQAELTIEITKGVEKTIPIAVVPFGWRGEGEFPVNIAAVIQANLKYSGLFNTLARQDMIARPTEVASVRFKNWRILEQEYLIIGQVKKITDLYQIQFQLFDVYKSKLMLEYQWTVTENEGRNIAHQISDLVYQKLIGKKGIFSTRIAFVTSTEKPNGKKNYQLLIADADGYNPQVIVSSAEPLMSPAWSLDGTKIAYVSFESKRMAIYVQTLVTAKKEKIASHQGINGAPAFSPDGMRLALTLSKDGSPDIYVLDLRNKELLKLTQSYSIDTEPSWSPDGKVIVYTSDRGGRPQLYSIPSTGGKASRLTFEGDYNARGRFSDDGKSLAMVHATRHDYRIAVMDIATGAVNVLTTGRHDESPSFSPNGDLILYTSHQNNKNILSTVSIDGKRHQNMSFSLGEVRDPAWSP